MLSKILYDTRNLAIVWAQSVPHGSAGMPSDKTLMKSGRVFVGEEHYYQTIEYKERITANQAKERLILENIDGDIVVKEKLKIDLSLSPNTIDLQNRDMTTLFVNIINASETDDIKSIDMVFEDAEFSISITNNEGSKQIEVSEAGHYNIKCVDDKFIENSITLEVV